MGDTYQRCSDVVPVIVAVVVAVVVAVIVAVVVAVIVAVIVAVTVVWYSPSQKNGSSIRIFGASALSRSCGVVDCWGTCLWGTGWYSND